MTERRYRFGVVEKDVRKIVDFFEKAIEVADELEERIDKSMRLKQVDNLIDKIQNELDNLESDLKDMLLDFVKKKLKELGEEEALKIVEEYENGGIDWGWGIINDIIVDYGGAVYGEITVRFVVDSDGIDIIIEE